MWRARNVYGFIIHWYVCENCGMVMHEFMEPGDRYTDYAFIAPYIIDELSVRPQEAI